MNNQQMSGEQAQRGWYSRGYVPHFDAGPIPQMVTFRLIDSFPTKCLGEWADELAAMGAAKAECERRRRIEEYLDRGFGTACLALPAVAQIVLQALQCFNGQRYQLHAWTVMPNHVHVLFTPNTGESLSQLLHSWKSFSANKANSVMGKTGSFWQREYFDRAVRNEEHFAAAIEYIHNNPVKAGLCQSPADWLFSSASPAQECQTFQKISVLKT
jgi:putative DNA methylase